ncbi:MAG TPA: hypothetical protein VKK79_07810 [Candidatus Lokiarchaeia archaeon]|nr:hypothetical protein [Candidatus Lokiarchaeia archaeon]
MQNTRFDFFSRLLWAPNTVKPQLSFQEGDKALWMGFLAGMIGLALQACFLLPIGTFVTIPNNALLQFWVDKFIYFGIGIVLSIFLWVFDVFFLSICKVRKSRRAVAGSFVPFVILPLVTVPIKALFPLGMSAAGHAEFVWMEIVLFFAWHNVTLGLLLVNGHYTNLDNRQISTKTLSIICWLLCGAEIGLIILSLWGIPLVFQSSLGAFFIRYL